MEKEVFLKKLEVELKIAKNSPYTLKSYIKSNENLLNFAKKIPEQITEDDVKSYVAENLSDKASSSIILFLSAIRLAYTTILKRDLTLKTCSICSTKQVNI